MNVSIVTRATEFAEDKNVAAEIRQTCVRPEIDANHNVVLDFTGVNLTTQSFVHALISDVLRTRGETVLKQLVFKGCNPAVQGIIETVVQYSLDTHEPID